MKYHSLFIGIGFVITVVMSTATYAFSVPQSVSAVAASKLVHIKLKATQGEQEAQFLLGLMSLSGGFAEENQQQGIKVDPLVETII